MQLEFFFSEIDFMAFMLFSNIFKRAFSTNTRIYNMVKDPLVWIDCEVYYIEQYNLDRNTI